MHVDLNASISVYARRVGWIRRFTESVEISALLAGRDGIRDRLRAGAVLDERQRAALLDADTRLLALAPLLSRRFQFDAEAAIREAFGEGIPDAAAPEPVAG